MSETPPPLIVAIDGPAGAGKSTVAREVARTLGFVMVDTGALYRAVALLALRRNIPLDDEHALRPLVDSLAIRFEHQEGVNRVWLGDEDVTQAIRTAKVANAVSQVSAWPAVRQGLLALQRQLAGEGSAVLEGRDIGTVVCPEAPIKVFLHASLSERARRRYEEMQARGEDIPMATVMQEMAARDQYDMSRAHAPLKAAADAIRLDCTRMNAQEVISFIVTRVHAHERMAAERAGPQKAELA
jgi:cytidylate kinase